MTLWELVPESIRQAMVSFFMVFGLAALGRMMWHVGEVQRQRRRFWSLHLIWELLTALAIGFVADGIATWLGFTGKSAMGVIIVVAYLGPRGLQQIVMAGLVNYKNRNGRI